MPASSTSRFRNHYDVHPTNVRVIALVSPAAKAPFYWCVVRRQPLATLCGLPAGHGSTMRSRAAMNVVDDLASLRRDMCPGCYAELVGDPDVQALRGVAGAGSNF